MKVIAHIKSYNEPRKAVEMAMVAGARGIYTDTYDEQIKSICAEYSLEYMDKIEEDKFFKIKKKSDFVRAFRKRDKVAGIIDYTDEKMITPSWKIIIKELKDPNDFREMVRNIKNYESILGVI